MRDWRSERGLSSGYCRQEDGLKTQRVEGREWLLESAISKAIQSCSRLESSNIRNMMPLSTARRQCSSIITQMEEGCESNGNTLKSERRMPEIQIITMVRLAKGWEQLHMAYSWPMRGGNNCLYSRDLQEDSILRIKASFQLKWKVK